MKLLKLKISKGLEMSEKLCFSEHTPKSSILDDSKIFQSKIIFLMSILALIVLTGCASEHDDELHDHSVEIEGKDMKLLTVQEVADLWEIDSEALLSRMITEFDLKESYTVDNVLEDIREEYPFSPAIIKNIAEEIKQQGAANE